MNRIFPAVVSCALALCAASCSPTAPTQQCPEGESICGMSCVDFQSDRQHCGECSKTCQPGQICTGGSCQYSCPTGQTICSERCVTLGSDADNCGQCGAACEPGTRCVSATCTAGCPAGQVLCGTKCVDPLSDGAFCGASADCAGANAGAACAAGEVCNAGACATSCQAGLVKCKEACVDPQTSLQFCGAFGTCETTSAGVACPPGHVCSAGQCALSCQMGLIKCGDKCVDPQWDRFYCGATLDCSGVNAGATCADGQVCNGGQCALSCQMGLINCNGKCVDPLTDRSFCGATSSGGCSGGNAGTLCASGEVCSMGTCAVSCQAGLLECSGKCVDPQTDRAFCGAGDCAAGQVGTVCASGELCSAGTCALSCQAGLLDCGGKCVDPQTDRSFCGASGSCESPNAGAVCGSGFVCTGGACVASCTAGLNACQGACVNLQTDNNNCGNCALACTSASTCQSGNCQPARSCNEIKLADVSAASGTYSIDPDGVGGEAPLTVYCDMATAGGGWTLCASLTKGYVPSHMLYSVPAYAFQARLNNSRDFVYEQDAPARSLATWSNSETLNYGQFCRLMGANVYETILTAKLYNWANNFGATAKGANYDTVRSGRFLGNLYLQWFTNSAAARSFGFVSGDPLYVQSNNNAYGGAYVTPNIGWVPTDMSAPYTHSTNPWGTVDANSMCVGCTGSGVGYNTLPYGQTSILNDPAHSFWSGIPNAKYGWSDCTANGNCNYHESGYGVWLFYVR